MAQTTLASWYCHLMVCGALCGVLSNSKIGGLKLSLEMCVLSALVVFAMVTSLCTVRCVSIYTLCLHS